MDIAKYIATAVILSSVFGEVEMLTMYVGGGLAIIVSLSIGLFLVSDKEINRNRNHNRNTQNN